ncbi:MAG: hypothetical protein EXS09_05700 [Gemmataceae bacterium]|nr:hypothetical protein [Gemmataceae bacterium]
MRRLIAGLAVALVVTSVTRADEKAEAIVKKSIEAHGGADALNKYKAGRMSMKGELSILGMDIEFSGKMSYMTPDRYRMEMEAQIMGQKLQMKQTVKGEMVKSVITIAGMSIPAGGDAEKDELKLASVMQEAERLTPLLDSTKFTLKVEKEEEVDGKKVDVVVITPKAVKRDVKFFFDQKTGLLVKTAHKGKGPGDDGTPKEVNEETYRSDFKKVSGVQTAQKLEVKHDGKKFMTVKASDIELLEKIDDKEFTIDD